jgi:hypothetical protein
MKKRAFITSLPCFGLSSLVLSAETAVKTGMKLEGEACAAQDPASMWQNLLATMQGNESSEQAQTRFYQAYAKCLGEWTESKYPEARLARPLLHSAWHDAMSFVVSDVWGGRIHVMPRLPAETEWIIWTGFDQGFEDASVGRYPPQAISNLLAMIFEAQAEPYLKLADSRAKIESCLAKLAEAEKHLPQKAHHFFRSHLIKRVGDCL